MAGDGSILDGDLVVVRVQPTAEQGAIVAVILDGEATVKSLKRNGTDTWLMPDNKNYEPIHGRRHDPRHRHRRHATDLPDRGRHRGQQQAASRSA